MKTFVPPKKALAAVQLRVLAVLLLLTAVTNWVWFLTPYIHIVLTVAAGIAVAVNFIYLPLYFKKYKIELRDNLLVIKSGVLIKQERLIPLPRLVFAERQTTILGRVMGVSSLIFRAARAVTLTAEFENKDIDEISEAIKKCL